THNPPPTVPKSVVEVPSPDINIGSAIKSAIRRENLPAGEENGELVVFKYWFKYWPDFPQVDITPSTISTRIPYNYAYKTWNLKGRWQWQGFSSGMRWWWEQNKDESGKESLGFDTKYQWNPDWKLSSSSSPVLPGGELAKRLVGEKANNIAKKADDTLAKNGDMSIVSKQTW